VSQFSANTKVNPKEHCNSITTRSGKVVGRGNGENLNVEMEVVEEKNKMKVREKRREVKEKW